MSSTKSDTTSSKKALFSSSVSFALPDCHTDEVSTPGSLLCSRHERTSSVDRDACRSENRLICTPNSSLRMEAPDDNSLMLLPLSQTMRETLNALAISTSNQLEIEWDELGCSPEERADQLTDLLSGFRRLCEEKINSERMVKKNFAHSHSKFFL